MRRLAFAIMIAFAMPVAAGGCAWLSDITASITSDKDANRKALTIAYATYDTTKAILKELADNGILKGDAAAQALKYTMAASAALSKWATNPDDPALAASAQAAIKAVSDFEKAVPRQTGGAT